MVLITYIPAVISFLYLFFIFFNGDLLYYVLGVQFLSLWMFFFCIQRKYVALFLYQILFLLYSFSICTVSYYGTNITLYEIKFFLQNVHHLRSSIQSLITYKFWVPVVAALTVSQLLYFCLSRRIHQSELPVGTPKTICQSFALFLFCVSFVPLVKYFEVTVVPPRPVSGFDNIAYQADSYRRFVEAFPENTPRLQSSKHVVVLFVCSLRKDHLSAYGYPRQTTPFLDSLVGKSLFFTQHYGPSGTSHNALFSALTGRYPFSFEKGEMTWKYGEQDRISLAEVLAHYGYRNLYSVSGSSEFGSQKEFALRHGFESVYDWESFPKAPRIDSWRIADDYVFDWIVETLATSTQPNFIFMFVMGMHHPAVQPSGGTKRYIDESEGATALINFYDEGLLEFDRKLEGFFVKLRERGLVDQTLLVVTGDHGESFGVEGGDHMPELARARSVFPEVVAAPLLIYDGDEGITVRELTSHTMLSPLILQYLRDGPEQFRYSLSSQRHFPLYNDYIFLSNPYTKIVTGVISDRFQYIKYYEEATDISGREFLYNLRLDPQAKHNLVGEEPDLTKRLEMVLDNTFYSHATLHQTGKTVWDVELGAHQRVMEKIGPPAP